MNSYPAWLLFAVLFVIGNCKHSSEPNKKCIQEFDVFQYRKEGMPVDSVTINGLVPFLMTKEQFFRIFGAVDSVIVAPVGFHTRSLFPDTLPENYFYHFIGQSVFVSKGDFIHPVLLDLGSTPVTLRYKQIEISRETAINYVHKSFPMSVKIRKGIEGNAFGGTVMIDATDWNGGANMWYLLFQSGSVSKIVLFTTPKYPLSDIPWPRR